MRAAHKTASLLEETTAKTKIFLKKVID